MQHELRISLYDLRDILKGLIGSSDVINIVTDSACYEHYIVTGYTEKSHLVEVEKDNKKMVLSIGKIKSIEFEGFHRYKGLSSKIFSLD